MISNVFRKNHNHFRQNNSNNSNYYQDTGVTNSNNKTNGKLSMDKNKKLFPQRLWELIHDEKYNFCLRWSNDGQRVYLNRNEFETHYLKTPNNQFHTQKAISFVRQMNMYGFRKVDDCYYENDNFKRNCPQLLRNMVRRHSNKALYPFSNASSDHHHHHHYHHHQQQQEQQQQLQQQHYPHNIRPHSQQELQLHQQQQQPHNLTRQRDLAQNPRPTSRVLHNSTQPRGHSSRNSPNSVTQSSDDGGHQPAGTSVAPTSDAPSAIAAAAAINSSLGNMQQNFVEEAANSLGQIQAALAMNTHDAFSDSQRLPLASTLYHRLTTLNLSQAGLAEQILQQQQRQVARVLSLDNSLFNGDRNETGDSPIIDNQTIASILADNNFPLINGNNITIADRNTAILQQFQQQHNQQQPQQNILELPIDQQQSLATAILFNLFGSLNSRADS